MISAISRYLDKLLLFTSIVITAMLTITISIAVIFRYFIKLPIPWAAELSVFLFCWITFLGGALAVRRSEMAAVTILVNRFPPLLKFVANIIIQLCVLVFSGVILYFSFLWVTDPRVINQTSTTLPIKLWLLYVIVPISMVCITIFCIEHLTNIFKSGIHGQNEEMGE